MNKLKKKQEEREQEEEEEQKDTTNRKKIRKIQQYYKSRKINHVFPMHFFIIISSYSYYIDLFSFHNGKFIILIN